jgi:ABC-type Fe3+/spermidine/putrescine transport system ATPase subunit
LFAGICGSGARAGEVAAVRLRDDSTIRCLFPAAHSGGGAVSVSVRPEAITLVASDTKVAEGENSLHGTVAATSFQGGNVRYDIRSGDLVVRVIGPAEPVFMPETDLLMVFPARSAVALPL